MRTAIAACVIFFAAGLALASAWLLSYKAESHVRDTHVLIERLQACESGASKLGYIARRAVIKNGDPAQVSLYLVKEAEVEKDLRWLEQTYTGRPKQYAELVRLRQFIHDRELYERKLLLLHFLNRQDDLDKVFLSGTTSLSQMDNIRNQLKSMEDSESAELQGLSDTYKEYKLLSFFSGVLLSIVGSLAIWQAIQKSRLSKELEAQKFAAYERLELLNSGLNKQVADLLVSQEKANKAIIARADFLAKVSHELRTPLAGIVGSAELALDADLSDEQRSRIGIIQKSSQHLLDLVNEILDFERLDLEEFKFEPSSFDLQEAVTKALQPTLDTADEKGLTVEITWEENTPKVVYGDKLIVQQILVNVLDSSIQSTDKGRISMRVAVETEDKDNVTLRFTVVDPGTGERSHSTPRTTSGGTTQLRPSRFKAAEMMGFGVDVNNTLVSLLKGTMQIKNEADNITTTTVHLPFNLRKAPEDEAHIATSDGAVAAGASAKILVVDDNEIIRTVTEAQLTRLGYPSDQVSSGEEAVEVTKNTRYILILMDIQMPGIDGMAATQSIRATEDNVCKDIPIVAYTAHAMPGDEAKFMQAGMTDYITKPITLEPLKAVIDKWTGTSDASKRFAG